MKDHMTSTVERNPLSIVIAGLYGMALATGAVALSSAGHGNYVLWGLFSAPASLFGYKLSLAVIIPFWLTAGTLAAYPTNATKRGGLVALLLFHYAGAWIVLGTDAYGNWSALREQWTFSGSRVLIIASIGVYVLGQVALWIRMLRSFTEN